jgi:hypothetical protein
MPSKIIINRGLFTKERTSKVATLEDENIRTYKNIITTIISTAAIMPINREKIMVKMYLHQLFLPVDALSRNGNDVTQ